MALEWNDLTSRRGQSKSPLRSSDRSHGLQPRIETDVQFDWLMAALQDASDGIVLLDLDGTIQLANPTAEEWGVRANGNSVLLQELTIASHANGHRGQLAATKRRQAVVALGNRMVEITVSPFEVGRLPAGYILILRDISAENALERARANFIARLKHDTRQQLQLLGVSLKGLHGRPEKRAEYLAHLQEEVQRLSHLFEQLCSVSTLTLPREEARTEQISLASAIEQGLECCQFLLAGRELEVDLPTGSVLPSIELRPGRLLIALTWLLMSGLPHTAQGTPVKLGVCLIAGDSSALRLSLEPLVLNGWSLDLADPQRPLWPGLREAMLVLERVWTEPLPTGSRLIISLKLDPKG